MVSAAPQRPGMPARSMPGGSTRLARSSTTWPSTSFGCTIPTASGCSASRSPARRAPRWATRRRPPSCIGSSFPSRAPMPIGHTEGSIGSVDRYLGLLAAHDGQEDDAERHLDAAIAANERIGARPWAAHARHDLARSSSRVVPARATCERADALERAALATARRLGMTALEAAIGGGHEPGPLPASRSGRRRAPRSAGKGSTGPFSSMATRSGSGT